MRISIGVGPLSAAALGTAHGLGFLGGRHAAPRTGKALELEDLPTGLP